MVNTAAIRKGTLLLLVCLLLPTAGLAASPHLRIEPGTNVVQVVLDPIPEPGALFLDEAADLQSLLDAPRVRLATNAPLASFTRIELPVVGGADNQLFFRVAFWPGLSVENFCSLAPELVGIGAGTFLMGSPDSEPERADWEGPQTLVTLNYGFKMGKYEVRQGEYQAVMGTNPAYFSGTPDRPVEQVTWDDAMDYCRRLTEWMRVAGCSPAGWAYRLPTEAEWEYACRAGTTSPFGYGPDLRSGMANFCAHYEYDETVGTVDNPLGTFLGRTTPAGSYAPNAWGLYDLHGNVWEWCLDGWSSHLPGGSVTNYHNLPTGPDRVIRGGCWYDSARFCRSAYRLRSAGNFRDNDLGFRVVLAPVMP